MQQFFSRATSGAITVSFHLLWAPCHRNELNGRPEMRHSLPMVPLSMRTYGFPPRQGSHTIGKSSPMAPAPA